MRKSPELPDHRVQEALTLIDVTRLLFAAVYTLPTVHDAYFPTSSLLDFTSLRKIAIHCSSNLYGSYYDGGG